MATGSASRPAFDITWFANATVPVCLVADENLASGLGRGNGDGLVRVDLCMTGSKITAIRPAGSAPRSEQPGASVLDLDGGMIWPCFVDMHTHLDKGHIWPRQSNPDGSFEGALNAVRSDREANWSADDLRARMEFSLKCAYVHGTSLLRTHLDTFVGQIDVTWPVFAELRDEWADRVALQGACLTAIDQTFDDALMNELVPALRRHGGILGSVTFMIPDLQEGLDRLFRTAIDNDFELDFHVDETGDPEARSLRAIADTALKFGFERRITVGHCCSLAQQPEEVAMTTLDHVAKAGIAVVSLPMCNLYLQDRQPGRTPRWRGVTLLHEMRDRGIPVSVASDNTRDPFYAYGDLDMLEVFREASRIIHLDHPFGTWPRSICTTPASVMGQDEYGSLAVGADADLVLFRARTWTELLSRPQSDRTVIRAGQPINTELPDYRELDAVLGEPT